METNPTLDVVRSILEQIDLPRSAALDTADPALPRVTVNGIRVPVVRVGWEKVGPFFEQLYDLANQRLFDGHLPRCRLSWNKRFRSVGGRIDCRARQLELSAAHFEACGIVALGVVVVHEQIHLSLYEGGLPWGHTKQFKARSHQLGLPDIHHEMPLPDRLKKRVRIHLFECRCGNVIRSRVRFRQPRACADCCNRYARGDFDRRFVLRYVGTESMEST